MKRRYCDHVQLFCGSLRPEPENSFQCYFTMCDYFYGMPSPKLLHVYRKYCIHATRTAYRLIRHSIILSCFFMAQQPVVGHDVLIIEASPSHSVTALSTSDQPGAENSTWQHTTFTRDRFPCSERDFEPALLAWERPQTNACNSAATGSGIRSCSDVNKLRSFSLCNI
jgi:hypothetical protein